MNGGHRWSGNGDHDFNNKMKPYICTLKQIKWANNHRTNSTSKYQKK
jgi:hypothetical protein